MIYLGDVQPYLALGQELFKHGHRVRVATHGTFRQFVADAKLEFFDVGGDPQALMSYMVRSAFVSHPFPYFFRFLIHILFGLNTNDIKHRPWPDSWLRVPHERGYYP